MSTKTYRRSIVLSVPNERMEAFYRALERLKARFPLFSQSAIIVYLVLDPLGQRLVSAYTGQHGASALAPPAATKRESVEYKSSLGVSIPEALRRPFFEALAQLEQHSTHRGKSPIILDVVIQADAEHVDHLLADHPPSVSNLWFETHQDDLSDEPSQAEDLHAPVDLVQFPELFKTAYYSGNTARLVGYVRRIEQQLVQSPPRSVDELRLHALIWQLIGKVLVDRGAFIEADSMLGHALDAAKALATEQPAESLNLMAAATYRQGSIYLQQYREAPYAVVQRSAAIAAKYTLEEAHRLATDPACRPAVRGVICMKYASMLAMPSLYPEPDVAHIRQLMTEALDLADVAQQEQQGYDPVGFMHHPSGVHHAWAKVTLELSRSRLVTVPADFALTAGEEHIRSAIASSPPDFPRWRDDFSITDVRLMLQHIESTITNHQEAIDHLRSSMPANTSQRMHTDLEQALERVPSIEERLRKLAEELHAVRKK